MSSALPVAWRKVGLSEVCECNPSKASAREQVSEEAPVSFVPMSDLGELSMYFSARESRSFADVVGSYTYFADADVLCAKITPCFENGKLGIARNLEGGIGFGSSEFFVIRSKGEVLPEFLFYFLSRDSFREDGERVMSGAVGHKRVPKDYFESLELPLPPFGEQKRIVALLDQAFAALDRARANAEANMADARSLFDGALRERLNDFAISEPHSSLAEMCNAIVDCEHKTAPVSETGFPSIRTPNIGRGVLNLDGVYRVSESTYREWTKRAVPEPGDLIMAREAPAGNVAVIPQGERVCLGQRTLLIKPKPDTTFPPFLAHLLLHPILQERLLSKSSGATVQHVNMRDIRLLPMPKLPPLQLQLELVSALERIREVADKLVQAVSRQLDDIAALRQSLLQAAFSGQLS